MTTWDELEDFEFGTFRYPVHGVPEGWYVGMLPQRKSIALYLQRGSSFKSIAWFVDEAAAIEFIKDVNRV